MLIDYYGIKHSHNFPGWQEALNIEEKYTRMDFLFGKMKEDLPIHLQNRFIPYIQLHEFEGLLFSDVSVIQNNFTTDGNTMSWGKGVFFNFVQPWGWGYSSCFHIFQLRKHLHISGFSYSESLLTWVTLCVLLYPWLYMMKIQLGRGGQGAKR